jgi:vanadium chloroperoxidase
MARDELTTITGVSKAGGRALRDIGIETPLDLVLAQRSTIRAALKDAGVQPVPSIAEIASWQDRAREQHSELQPGAWEVGAAQVARPAVHLNVPVATGSRRSNTPAERSRSIAVPFEGPPQVGPLVTIPDAPPDSLLSAENPIREWNAVALEANRVGHTTGFDGAALGPTQSARALAMVHLAMHDAYFAITGQYPTYLPGLPTVPPGASADAAAEAAARTVLAELYPSQVASFQRPDPVEPSRIAGRDFGVAVGEAILIDRYDDPGAGDEGYVPSTARGRHRPDPANPDSGFYGPFVGGARLFATGTRYGLDLHPAVGSPEYLAALREVRGKGITPHLAGTLPGGLDYRTPDETVTGLFWAYDGPAEIGTPPRLYNQIVRAVSKAQNNSTADDARLFALVNAAMADAGILAWHEKYAYDLWRPVLAIREHDPSMGPEAIPGPSVDPDCDGEWLPLGAPRTNPKPYDGKRPRNFTPPFPAYPSGHATFGAAALQSVRRYYGITADGPDDLFAGLSFVSDELDGQAVDERGDIRPRHARTFPDGLWQMIEENGRSRVYLGVHYVFDAFAVDDAGQMDLTRNIGGVPLGLNVANDLAVNGLLRSNGAA